MGMALIVLGVCLWVFTWFIEFEWKHSEKLIRVVAFIVMVIGFMTLPTLVAVANLGG